MIKQDYDKLVEIARSNQCSEHKKPLEVAWHGEESSWVLRCGEGHYPDAVTKKMSFAQEVKQGKHEEVAEAAKVRQKHEAMEKQKLTTAVSDLLPGVPTTDLATGAQLPLEVIQALVVYAHKYHLDPVRQHVCIMYSKPYITLDGYLYHANRSNIAYSLMSRPMTTEEEKQYKIEPTDIAWLAKIRLIATDQEFTGLGIVTYEEMTAMSEKHPTQLKAPVVAKHPQQLAQKRAEWQASRRAFPIGESTEGE